MRAHMVVRSVSWSLDFFCCCCCLVAAGEGIVFRYIADTSRETGRKFVLAYTYARSVFGGFWPLVRVGRLATTYTISLHLLRCAQSRVQRRSTILSAIASKFKDSPTSSIKAGNNLKFLYVIP